MVGLFSLLPADPELIRDFDHMGPVPLKLRVRLRNPIGLDRLARLLIALCGAQVDVAPAMGSAAPCGVRAISTSRSSD